MPRIKKQPNAPSGCPEAMPSALLLARNGLTFWGLKVIVICVTGTKYDWNGHVQCLGGEK